MALKCYLRCLRGLLDPTGFTYIPQCLHRVMSVYINEQFVVKKYVYDCLLAAAKGVEKTQLSDILSTEGMKNFCVFRHLTSKFDV